MGGSTDRNQRDQLRNYYSSEQEYSNYNSSNNGNNALLQKRYNDILAKRFPKSKSEETTAHQTPCRNGLRSSQRK